MTALLDETMFVLGDLVGFPTVTAETNLDLIEYARGRLAAVGADCRITHDETHTKANLFATIGPLVDGGVVLSGHSDVVPAEEPDWTGAPFVAMRRSQRIYGRGTADMKGFIACALAAAPAFAETALARPLHIAITFDEEVGCRGAPLLLADLTSLGINPAAAIVGEPTGLEVVTAHKGCYEFTTTITGLEGHGSAPDRAVNAVQFGARYVARLMELGNELRGRAPSASPYDPPHSTISVGRLVGGAARNIVAGECTVEWEMRPVNREDADLVHSEMSRFEGELSRAMGEVSDQTALVTTTEGAVDGLDSSPDSAAVLLARHLLDEPTTTVASFGTEAGLFQQAGIPAVVCGPGSIEVAHRPNEYVELDQLRACLTMIDRLRHHLEAD